MSLQTIMLADSPTGLWRFDDAALTAGKLVDQSGNGNGLTVTGAPTLNAVAPPATYSGAAKAIGLGTGIGSSTDVFAWTPGATIGVPFTVETWWYMTSQGSANAGGYLWGSRSPEYGCAGGVACAGQNSPREGMNFDIGDNSAGWYALAQGPRSPTQLGVWHHSVYVLTATGWLTYLDNNLLASGALTPTNAHLADTGRPLVWGYWKGGGAAADYRFNGYLWYAAIYPTALSAARVTARWNEVGAPAPAQYAFAASPPKTAGPLARSVGANTVKTEGPISKTAQCGAVAATGSALHVMSVTTVKTEGPSVRRLTIPTLSPLVRPALVVHAISSSTIKSINSAGRLLRIPFASSAASSPPPSSGQIWPRGSKNTAG